MANEFIARKGLIVSGSTVATSAITAPTFTSTQATGTAPFTVASTTAVTNLNADLLDGNHAAAFYLASNPSGYTTNTGTVTSVIAGNGLTGGTITSTGTITVDTGSTHFITGSVNSMNLRGVFSSSGQVAYTGLSSIPSGIISSSTQQVVSTYTNATDNRVLTSTGAGGINGESTLTYDGTVLSISTNGAKYFQGGDDAALYDVNVSNTLGIHGQQDPTVGAIKLGSSGQTIYSNATGVGIATTSPGATLHVQGTVSASGNVLFGGNLTVSGLLSAVSTSIQYVTSSQLNVSDNKITVQTNDLVRFGGLSVYDSGSSNATASIYWDSQNHNFIYENLGGSSYNSAIIIAGPQNTSPLGNEVGLTTNRVPVAVGTDHIDSRLASSSIRIDFPSRFTHIEAGLHVTGSVTSSVGFSGSGTGITGLTNANLSGTAGITNANLANSTISGVALGSNLNTLTISSPLSGTGYNGSAAVTIALASGYGDTQNPFASKTANHFLAAPNGSAGAPTFRAIVAADIPTLNQNTTGTASNITAYTINQNVGTANSPSFVTITSTQATGTAPFTVASTTAVTNLNADYLDGQHGSYYAADSLVIKLAGDQTITGQKTFPSAIGDRPILSGGFLSALTGDLNTDIWGISEEYYPSHGTAANAWGIRWDGDSNQIRFIGAGTQRLVVDLDGGTTGLTWEGNTIWNAGNDGASSGLDADLLDGNHASAFYLATNPSGYTTNTGTVTSVAITAGTGLSGGGTVTTSGTITLNTDMSELTTSTTNTHGDFFIVVDSADNAQYKLTKANIALSGFNNDSGWTSNTGTVTSVGGTGTVSGLTLSGTVTTTGNLTLGGTLSVAASNFSSQTANTFLAAPNGSAGTPTFRAIAAADVPTLNQNTTGTASNITAYTINQNVGTGNSPSFAGLTVDTNTLYVDATNDRVGIGTTSPSQKLTVLDTLSITNTAGAQYLLMGNQDSVGVNNPAVIQAANGALSFGGGTAWTGTGGTFTSTMFLNDNGNVGIGTTSPTRTLTVNGSTNITGSLDVTGAFTAQTKSFKIQHQTQPDKSLVYGVLEGPEHAVYVRGRLTNNNTIILPPEWDWLIDPSSITVQLTPIGSHQKLYVEKILNNVIFIQNENLLSKKIDCYYLIHATRKDVGPLQTVQ